MTLKVYLAGEFYQENDWRYGVVKGLKECTFDPHEQWPALPNSILGCLDFVGPYPQDFAIRWHRAAINDADIVFLWFPNQYSLEDISKMCFELGYAGGLEKGVIFGCEAMADSELEIIRFAICGAGVSGPNPCIANDPAVSLQKALAKELEYLPAEQSTRLKMSGQVARKIFRQQIDKAGYIYVIRADTGHYKIGRTNNVPNRMRLFAVKLPFDFKIIHHFPCLNMYEAEAELHKVFSGKRVNGEWFNLSEDDVSQLTNVHEWARDLFLDKCGNLIEALIPKLDKPWWSVFTPEELRLIQR